jgi:hypothetical protein
MTTTTAAATTRRAALKAKAAQLSFKVMPYFVFMIGIHHGYKDTLYPHLLLLLFRRLEVVVQESHGGC